MTEIIKKPIDMNYNELNDLLDVLLKASDLPSSVQYSGDKINYHRYSKFRLLMTTLYRIIEAELFYRTQIKRRLGSYKRARFLKSFKPYFYNWNKYNTAVTCNM